MILLLLLVIVVMAVLGAPLFTIVLAGALLGWYAADQNLAIVAADLFRVSETPMLVALPLFTYAGYVLAEARTSERLVNLVQSVFGGLPSGLALVGFVACALFTALTGASGVTIVALGALLLPALKSAGYSDKFALGLVTTSGSLGLLLVPSVPLILYGIVAQTMEVGEPFTIFELFQAGVLPLLLDLGAEDRLESRCRVVWVNQDDEQCVLGLTFTGFAGEGARRWANHVTAAGGQA